MINGKIGFIGTGNMGGPLLRAAAKALDPSELLINNRRREKSDAIALETGSAVASNRHIAESCGMVILGVKPQMMAGVLSEIAPALKLRDDDFMLVSMAAGVSIERIRAMAGGAYPVIRIMPNLPASVGEGMILYSLSDGVTPAMADAFCDAFKLAGSFDRLPEELIDVGCAISGCGPAFVSVFVEALADGAVECGLPRDKAYKYAEQTLYGTSRLLMESGMHPGHLKDLVCNPGGSTITGLHAMESRSFRAAAMEAITAAFQKTVKIGK